MKRRAFTHISLVPLAAMIMCQWSSAGGKDDKADDTALSKWKDDAAAKTTMSELIGSLKQGDKGASLSHVVRTDGTDKAAAIVKDWIENWSEDIRAGCYSSRVLCVKTADGTWGIAFFVHRKEDLAKRDGASQRFQTPKEDFNYWGMACYYSKEGWKLVPPGTGQKLPGYDEFLKVFRKDCFPLQEAVKKEHKDVSSQKQ